MFRLVSKAPLVVAACLRFQAAPAAGGAPGMRRRRFRTTWDLPRFEIHDVRDDPALGTMTRVAVDERQLLISQYPQLGPRKVDSNDVTPQFDRDRRISVRMRHMDLAGLVAVVENRIPSHHMKNNAYDLVFEKTTEGYTLKGHVHRATSTKSEEWSIQFNNQFATMMEHFLESALTESFGFARFSAYQQSRQSSNSANDGGSYQQNINRGSSRNNDNRRNSRPPSQRQVIQ